MMVIYNIRCTLVYMLRIHATTSCLCVFLHFIFSRYLYIAAGKYPGYIKVDHTGKCPYEDMADTPDIVDLGLYLQYYQYS